MTRYLLLMSFALLAACSHVPVQDPEWECHRNQDGSVCCSVCGQPKGM